MSYLKKAGAALLLSACLPFACLSAASAQDGDSPVVTRNPFEHEPIPAGPFMLDISANAGIQHDGNIFFSAEDETSDQFATLGVRTDAIWESDRLRLDLDGSVANRTYFDNSDLNRTDYDAGGRVLYRLSDVDSFSVGASRARLTESFTDINSPMLSRELTQYSVTGYELAYTRETHPVGLRTTLAHRRSDYDDIDLAGGGTIFQDYRDNEHTSGTVEVVWQRPENIALSILAGADFYSFNSTPGVIDRSNQSQSLLLGVSTGRDRIVSMEVYGGWEHTVYDSPMLEDNDGFRFEGEAVYRPTRLTDVTFSAIHRRRPATLPTESGVDVTDIGVRIDHEIRPNWIVSAEASGQNYDFTDTDRRDKGYDVSVGSTYFIGPKLAARVEASVLQRNTDYGSTLMLEDLERTRPRIGFTLTFTP